MKKHLAMVATLLAAGIALSGTVLAQQVPPPSTTPAPAASEFKNDTEKNSYAIGIDVGSNVAKSLKRSEIDVDPAMLLRGFKESFNGEKLLMTDEEMKDILTKLQADTKVKLEAKAKAAAETNKKEGDDFLAANKSKEGVVTLPDSMQYKVLKQGNGPKPTATDTVECNYRGTLINGTEFDSSYKRGQPVSFGVGQVIRGWSEILQLMPVGSKYQVFIPSELAYGPRGSGADIGPNATLIFEIELISIKSDAVKPAAPAAKPAPATKPSAPAAK
jgi:FKBP-type peptidyl-prolyl cis-trans isomerase FklB